MHVLDYRSALKSAEGVLQTEWWFQEPYNISKTFFFVQISQKSDGPKNEQKYNNKYQISQIRYFELHTTTRRL